MLFRIDNSKLFHSTTAQLLYLWCARRPPVGRPLRAEALRLAHMSDRVSFVLLFRLAHRYERPHQSFLLSVAPRSMQRLPERDRPRQSTVV